MVYAFAEGKMSEITVIQQTDEERVLSKEEREVELRELSRSTKIPLIYFENIAKLEDLESVETTLAIRPTIPALIIRKLLEFNCVFPIIKTFPKRYQTTDSTIIEFGAKKIYGKCRF